MGEEWEAHSLPGCDREGINGHKYFSSGVQRLQSYRLLSPVLFYEGKGHVNEVIPSLNYETYTVGRRKVKSKRM